MTSTTQSYQIRRMAGPCANGFEGNGGTRWHALAEGKALCGARCKSFWSDEKGVKVTCPRCLAKIARAMPSPLQQGPVEDGKAVQPIEVETGREG